VSEVVSTLAVSQATPKSGGIMTTLSDRPRTALLVVDRENGVVAAAHQRDAVVANIVSRVERARAADAPVVWVHHSDKGLRKGSAEWEYVPELLRAESETLIATSYGDAFEGTDLESVLANAAVGVLVVAGAETDACIRSTIHGAFARGYDATLVGDAHTAGDKTAWGPPPVEAIIAHTNLYRSSQRAPGRTAAVTSTADVLFAD
jgi:nicotinamidase-related amidase